MISEVYQTALGVKVTWAFGSLAHARGLVATSTQNADWYPDADARLLEI